MKLADFLIQWSPPPSEVARQLGQTYARAFSSEVEAAELRKLAEPRDETETLATCPECACMGHHPVEVKEWEARGVRTPEGGWICMATFGDPPAGTRMAWRTCIFCGHIWGRS